MISKALSRCILSAFALISLHVGTPAYAQTITEIADGTFGCYEEDGVTDIVRLFPDNTYSFVSYNRVRARIRGRISDLRDARADARDDGNFNLVSRLRERILLLRSRVEGIDECWNSDGGGSGGGGGNGGGISNGSCEIIGDNGSFSGDGSSYSPRIITGELCERTSGDSPVLYLELLDGQGDVFSACTGSLVSEDVVITAAHCLNDGVAGARVISPLDSVESYDFDWHSGYLSDDMLSQEAYDVGVVRLPRQLSGTRMVSLLESDDLQAGERVVIAGYGLTEEDESGDLRAGFMTIASSDSLGIVANYDGSDSNTCSGDSGGPLLVERGGEWFIAGLTSWGEIQNCGVGDVSYFSNINDPAVRSFLSSAGGL